MSTFTHFKIKQPIEGKEDIEALIAYLALMLEPIVSSSKPGRSRGNDDQLRLTVNAKASPYQKSNGSWSLGDMNDHFFFEDHERGEGHYVLQHRYDKDLSWVITALNHRWPDFCEIVLVT